MLVLSPGAIGHVYGIDSHSSGEAGHFYSYFVERPRGIVGSDVEFGERTSFMTADLPWRSNRRVPVWGVLHRCSASNLHGNDGAASKAPMQGGDVPAVDRPRVCAAMQTLAAVTSDLDASLLRQLEQAGLPDDVHEQLRALRMWPSNAHVDLATSASVVSNAPRDAVCVLSVASMAALQAQHYCSPPPAPPPAPPSPPPPPSPLVAPYSPASWDCAGGPMPSKDQCRVASAEQASWLRHAEGTPLADRQLRDYFERVYGPPLGSTDATILPRECVA